MDDDIHWVYLLGPPALHPQFRAEVDEVRDIGATNQPVDLTPLYGNSHIPSPPV